MLCDLNVTRQSACLVFNPIMVDSYAAFFNCTPVGRASDYDGPNVKLFILVGLTGASCLLPGSPGFKLCFSFAPGFSI